MGGTVTVSTATQNEGIRTKQKIRVKGVSQYEAPHYPNSCGGEGNVRRALLWDILTSLRPNAFPLNQRGQYERGIFPECGLTRRRSYRSYGVNTYQRSAVGDEMPGLT